MSVDSVTRQLDTAYEQAKDNGQPAAMVQATMGQAKVHGLLVDRTEDVTKAAQDMTDAELAAKPPQRWNTVVAIAFPHFFQKLAQITVVAGSRRLELGTPAGQARRYYSSEPTKPQTM